MTTVREVTVYGHRIRVGIRPGSGTRTPLVMCCGIGASFEVMDQLVDAIDPSIEIIRFDVPGVGKSPTPLLPYGFAQLAAAVAKMLSQLEYDEFDVLGYSWGGALAQQLAAQYPRKVRRAILLATGTGALMVPGSPAVLSRMLSPRRFRDPEYGSSVAALLYGGSARTRADDVLKLFRDKHSGGSARGYVYQLLAGSVWTSLPFLWMIRQPTLVMVGNDDPIVPQINGEIMAKLLPRGHLHVFGGGHVDPVMRARSIAPVIVDFVNAESEAAFDDSR